MKKIILFLLVAYSTTFYGQEVPLRKSLKGKSFINAFLGNDTYLGGKLSTKLKTQLFEAQYEYFLSNQSSIGVFGSYGERLTEEDSIPKYSDYSVGLIFNQRISSGVFLTKEFYSYIGVKAGHRGITYEKMNKNLILVGVYVGGKWFVGRKISIQLDLGGMVFPKENNYGIITFSPRVGIAYKI